MPDPKMDSLERRWLEPPDEPDPPEPEEGETQEQAEKRAADAAYDAMVDEYESRRD